MEKLGVDWLDVEMSSIDAEIEFWNEGLRASLDSFLSSLSCETSKSSNSSDTSAEQNDSDVISAD